MLTTEQNPAQSNVSQSAIISMSVREWAIEKGYTAGMSKVIALNTNGYPFITFLHKSNKTAEGKTEALNVYFSVKAAELVDEGEVINADFMNQFQMSYATCASAEEGYAWKLCRKGESDKYQDVLAIL